MPTTAGKGGTGTTRRADGVGDLAAIVLLIGVAFGAASRKTPPPSVEASSPP